MNAKMVRITDIRIQNFKNVINGKLTFENPKKNYKASILGIYGQNGSGKTALIDAVELLQHALCGRPVPEKFADFVNVNAEEAILCYDLKVEFPDQTRLVSYEIGIQGYEDDSEQNLGNVSSLKKKVRFTHELIKCPIIADSEHLDKRGRLIDTDDELFAPISKRVLLVGKEKEVNTHLIVAKRLTQQTSRSFAFSRELLSVIRSKVQQEQENAELQYYASLMEALVEFGNHGLFVINTANSGFISLNAQPLMFKYKEANKRGVVGTIMLSLEGPTMLNDNAKVLVENIIGNMNVVLRQLIPGLTIGVREIGTQLMENGEVGHNVQLTSRKNEKEIALKYESEGIKKIVSILQLLIVVYNNPFITVAVDELDSGVFEYLLGELLRIVAEKGKGQLIFTSHNLRPLETLDRGFIAFTTTNPQNRYFRLANVKGNNNLRDFYYRDIMLGEQKEELYEATNNSEIALAFREAGEFIGA